MKSSTRFIFASLALNAVLVGVWVKQSENRRERIPSGIAQMAPSSETEHPRSNDRIVTSAAPAPHGLWAHIAADDCDDLVRRLRFAGFPRDMVRCVAFAVFEYRFQLRRDALAAKVEPTEYSQDRDPFGRMDPEEEKASDAMEKEWRNLVRKLNAECGYDEKSDLWLRWHFEYLPIEKARRIQELREDSATRMSDAYHALEKGAASFSDDFRQLEINTQRELQADLARLLTPSELEQYELQSSGFATSLVRQLQTFRPTEDEYKAIYALRRQFDDRFPDGAANDRAAYDAARAAMNAGIESKIGAERYAEYAQAVESKNQDLCRLMARLDLPLTVVGEISAVRDETSATVKAIRANASLSDAERHRQLAALAAEASTRLKGKLGDRGFVAYAELKGDWLRAIEPPSGAPLR